MLLRLAPLAPSCALVGKSMRPAATTALRVGHFMPFPNPGRSLHTSRSAKAPETEEPPFARSHLTTFFAQYPKFKYDQSQPFMDEFWRLVSTEGFGRRGKRYKSARKQVGDAILRQFKDIYGAHSCDIHVWHQFFSAIGIDEAPRDIGLCHRRSKSIHLNICDLIDRPVTGIYLTKFPNQWELSRYTLKDSSRPKIVPPISKKKDPILGRCFGISTIHPSLKPRALTQMLLPTPQRSRKITLPVLVSDLIYIYICST
ncbi:hypothetical protein B0J17DRAFT_770582 [Rhizoctonia solani]|nr:hypothetical protein B0J17DRAFT_770582 [Rhizoctonia solani]